MKNKNFISYIIMMLKGIVVGFGAIMPGISGGALCVAFGMYHILLDVLSRPFKTLKEHGIRLAFFVLGGGIGFVGLSGIGNWLLGINENAVICVFVGFMIGTIPELWRGAGQKGRPISSYISLCLSFGIMLTFLLLLAGTEGVFIIAPGFLSFLLCGALWGLSFIVPGLSSSTLPIFFGLYQPMLNGISSLSFSVIIPLGIGGLLCLVILSRIIKFLYSKWYATVSHTVIGVMLASTVAIFPVGFLSSASGIITAVICVIGGTLASYFAGVICEKLEQKATNK